MHNSSAGYYAPDNTNQVVNVDIIHDLNVGNVLVLSGKGNATNEDGTVRAVSINQITDIYDGINKYDQELTQCRQELLQQKQRISTLELENTLLKQLKQNVYINALKFNSNTSSIIIPVQQHKEEIKEDSTTNATALRRCNIYIYY